MDVHDAQNKNPEFISPRWRDLIEHIYHRVSNLLFNENQTNSNVDRILKTLEYMLEEDPSKREEIESHTDLVHVDILDGPDGRYSWIVEITPDDGVEIDESNVLSLHLNKYSEEADYELHDLHIPESLKVYEQSVIQRKVEIAKRIVKQIQYGKYSAESQKDFNYNLLYNVRDALTAWIENPTEDFPNLNDAQIISDMFLKDIIIVPNYCNGNSPVIITDKNEKDLNISLIDNRDENVERLIEVTKALQANQIAFVKDILNLHFFFENQSVPVITEFEVEDHARVCMNMILKNKTNSLAEVRNFGGNVENWLTLRVSDSQFLVTNPNSEWMMLVDLDPIVSTDCIKENTLVHRSTYPNNSSKLNRNVTSIKYISRAKYEKVLRNFEGNVQEQFVMAQHSCNKHESYLVFPSVV